MGLLGQLEQDAAECPPQFTSEVASPAKVPKTRVARSIIVLQLKPDRSDAGPSPSEDFYTHFV